MLPSVVIGQQIPSVVIGQQLPSVVIGQQLPSVVPAGSPSHGGHVAVYVFDVNQPSLPTAFYSVLVSVSVFMALSTVFHFGSSRK